MQGSRTGPERLDAPVPRAAQPGSDASCGRDEQAIERLVRRALVFEHMQGAVIITDLDGRIVDWNPAAELVFGYTLEEMLGRRVTRLYRLDAPGELEREILDAMAQRSSWLGELRFVRKDGTEGVCETMVVPLLDERGQRVATIGVNRDITARRQTETALAEAHSMMRAIIDGTSDAVFVKDVHGRYVMINAAGSRILGKAIDEVIGRDDWELFPPAEAEAFRELDRQIMSRGEPYTFEETITSAGALRRMSTTKAPWRNARGETVGLIGISRDISARWEAEEAARRHREDLAHVLRVRTIGEMAAGLGHEINQPLGAITNYAQGCVRRLRGSQADADLIAAIEEISAQALRAGHIVRRLGDFVRKQPARRETVALATLIHSAVRMIELEALADNVALELALDPTLWVRVDPVQIEQVVLNVLLNGLQAMQDEAERPKMLSIRTRAVAPELAQVEIIDTGPGLPKEQTTEIFEPFVSTKPNGLGMGLAISRSIMEAHDGSLRAENGHSGGAIFFLQLPLAPGESPA